MRQFIRPRDYIRSRAAEIYERELRGAFLIGVHARGTDAAKDVNGVRVGLLAVDSFVREVDALITANRRGKIFLATDEEFVVNLFRKRYGDKVFANDFIPRKAGGATITLDPNGWSMPAFVAND